MYWPEVQRGTERLLHDLGSRLVERGLEVTLITSHRAPRSRSVEDGIEVIRVRRLPDGLLRGRATKYWLGHLPGSYLELRRGDYDLVHAAYPTDAVVAARWAKATRRPAVFSVHGILSVPTSDVGRWHRAGWRMVRDGTDAVVAASEAVARTTRELGANPRVIYPGVDLDAFSPAAERADEPTIFCPGAVGEERKQVGLLIDAFTRFREQNGGGRLVLSDHAAAVSELPPGVELRNFGLRETLIRTYSEAWLTVLPAHREAFGLVLVESLACGTPVVGLNEGGIAEIVDRPEVGSLVEGDDPAALASAIEKALPLAQKAQTRDACRARAADFSIDRTVDAHLDLYRELLGSAEPSAA